MDEETDLSLSEGIETYHVFHRHLAVRGTSYGLYLTSAISAYRRLSDAGFRPDLIHAHVYGAGVPAAVIGTRSATPVVLTEHFSGFALRSLSRIEARKARYAYSRVARALPVSQYLREAILAYGIDVPFEVVPNVVDASLFFPGTASRGDGGVKKLIFVGNPSEEKGFPTLLQALNCLNERRRDWRLDVMGEGPERAEGERSTAALGLGEQVTFRGARPKSEIAELMRAADLFVLPSRLETFGAAIAEALASGLPVVSTAAGGIPELVNERNGRLVARDDPVALAHALVDALENIAAFDRRAIAEAAAQRYGLEVVGEQLTRIYESVVADSRPGNSRRA
jgi:glycosyltransferase involved in cell wall biosynthesis